MHVSDTLAGIDWAKVSPEPNFDSPNSRGRILNESSLALMLGSSSCGAKDPSDAWEQVGSYPRMWGEAGQGGQCGFEWSGVAIEISNLLLYRRFRLGLDHFHLSYGRKHH